MKVAVYQVAGSFTRSIVNAVLVTEVYIDEWPDDEQEFAEQYGGDFIVLLDELEELEEDE